jgi:class 3 adenylate cyclase
MSEVVSFGDWIRRRRRALDLTREALAQQVSCAVVTIRKIETDERRPSQEMAERLANCLRMPADQRDLFMRAARAVLVVEDLADPAIPLSAPITTSSGTLTFLFTDIAGSSRLWEQHPDEMPVALARHDSILRASISAQGGSVFKTVGDAFCAVFDDPRAALLATLDAQRALTDETWGAPGPLQVRMAIHSGVAEARAGDYFGTPLNRVARLLSIGHGGQVLLSSSSAELVRDRLPPATTLHELGAHQLRDLERPEQVFQPIAPGLPVEFPPCTVASPSRATCRLRRTR